MKVELADLLNRVTAPGQVRWIGERPAREAPVIARDTVEIDFAGLATGRGGAR